MPTKKKPVRLGSAKEPTLTLALSSFNELYVLHYAVINDLTLALGQLELVNQFGDIGDKRYVDSVTPLTSLKRKIDKLWRQRDRYRREKRKIASRDRTT